MFIYLLDRTDEVGYDETESVVVVANTPKQSRTLAKAVGGDQADSVWDTAKLKNLGTARKGVKQGVVHSSFNAG